MRNSKKKIINNKRNVTLEQHFSSRRVEYRGCFTDGAVGVAFEIFVETFRI